MINFQKADTLSYTPSELKHLQQYSAHETICIHFYGQFLGQEIFERACGGMRDLKKNALVTKYFKT